MKQRRCVGACMHVLVPSTDASRQRKALYLIIKQIFIAKTHQNVKSQLTFSISMQLIRL